jgi:hypothetical protein
MNTQAQAEIAEASQLDEIRTVTLDYPIKRGEGVIAEVTIRRPYGSALKGLSLAKLVNEADHDAFAVLIPRITSPMIAKQDIDSGALAPSDLLQIIGQVTDFFIPKWARETNSPTA